MGFSTARRLSFGTLTREYPFLLIIALALLVRLYGITHSPLWFDEAFSVVLSNKTPASIWSHTADDVHPPLYYLLLRAWMLIFGDSVFSVRAMSALVGELTVVMGIWLVRVLAGHRAAILGGILLALLPIAVRYSQEARMYALLALFCIAATLALACWIMRPERRGYLYIYTLMMAAGFYTHYFAAPCLISHWLYLLFVRRPAFSPLRTYAWWSANIAIVVLFAPWLPSLIAQLRYTEPLGWVPQVTAAAVLSQPWQFLTLEFGSEWPVQAYVLTPLAVLIMVIVLLNLDKDRYRPVLLLVLYTVVPILLIAVVSLKLPLFWPRYFLFSAIGLPLIIGLGLDKLMHLHRWLGILFLVMIISLQCFGLYNVYSANFKLNNPYQQVELHVDAIMGYVNRHWTVGDRVLIEGIYLYPVAVYYNRTGTQPLLYTPGAPWDSRPGKRGWGSLWHRDADALFIDNYTLIPPDTHRVWLIYEALREPPKVPQQWRPFSGFAAGGTQLRLYSLEQAELP
ncbi:membrane protein [Paucimonas lemoignei]|nr:membrane protein [Paucimonas lemoignei]